MIRFVVQDENMFGYIDPRQPNHIGILATSIIRGCTYSWKDGIAPAHHSRIRPATLSDFDTYFVSSEGYRKDTTGRYDFPTN